MVYVMERADPQQDRKENLRTLGARWKTLSKEEKQVRDLNASTFMVTCCGKHLVVPPWSNRWIGSIQAVYSKWIAGRFMLAISETQAATDSSPSLLAQAVI